jgi:hypothetical protein
MTTKARANEAATRERVRSPKTAGTCEAVREAAVTEAPVPESSAAAEGQGVS